MGRRGEEKRGEKRREDSKREDKRREEKRREEKRREEKRRVYHRRIGKKRKEAEWRKGDNKGNLDSLTDLSTKEKQGDGQIEFIHLLETF